MTNCREFFYMYICCICYWFYLRRNDVQIIRQVDRNDIRRKDNMARSY